MLKSIQGVLSSVAGTAEPHYGKEALWPVHGVQRPATAADLRWQPSGSSSTRVETQTWYFQDSSGYIGFVQVAHSHIAPMPATLQFNCGLWHATDKSAHSWSSQHLAQFEFHGSDLTASHTSIVLRNDEFSVKCAHDKDKQVDLVFKRTAPGFLMGDGTTRYGTQQNKPWGSVRHVFWPQVALKGHIVLKGRRIELSGPGLFVMATQGMKPHHAAAKWNFGYFQGPTTSAVLMEFTTPAAYDSTRVAVGAVVRDGEIAIATTDAVAVHEASKLDKETAWPKPMRVSMTWRDGSTARLDVTLDCMMHRFDVMAEVPTVFRNVASGISGAHPYIYQFYNRATLCIEDGDQSIREEGMLLSEATFIT